MKWCVLTLLSITAVHGLQAQDATTVDRVQAVITGLRTAQQALHVDEQLRRVEGVLLSRTDLHTQNLFMLVRHDSPLQPSQIEAFLTPLGLTLQCWSRTSRTGEPFRALDPEHCGDHPLQK